MDTMFTCDSPPSVLNWVEANCVENAPPPGTSSGSFEVDEGMIKFSGTFRSGTVPITIGA